MTSPDSARSSCRGTYQVDTCHAAAPRAESPPPSSPTASSTQPPRGGVSHRSLHSLPIFQTVLNGITVKGSIVGTRQDLREVFDLHARGLTSVTREIRPLDTVNSSIADVLAGSIEARIVFDPTLVSAR